ncbi:hypothetical protein [Candidatus Poriferisodalis sp.]|uniref:hypothetical protein n=1 Tax=Candidatus Poriferisodalis sp. TaxID=3101277 RepID=UPI003B02A0CD
MTLAGGAEVFGSLPCVFGAILGSLPCVFGAVFGSLSCVFVAVLDPLGGLFGAQRFETAGEVAFGGEARQFSGEVFFGDQVRQGRGRQVSHHELGCLLVGLFTQPIVDAGTEVL